MKNQINENSSQQFVLPLFLVGIMFFSIGFALGINSYLIPLLEQTLEISSAKSYLVLAATFSSFLIFGYPASLVIKNIGYKKTMSLAFILFALGFFLYLPSAKYESLALFLVASFISGMGNTFLQASVNPYVTILGPLESAAKRISFMGIANKLAWASAPMFLAFMIGKDVKNVSLVDTQTPFIFVIFVFIALGIFAFFSPLPEVEAAGESEESTEDCPYAANKKSIWQFPHLLLGVLALFLYVGVETVSLGTLIDYAQSINLPNPENYAWIAPIGMIVGYLAGIILIPKYISQSKALLIVSIIALVGSFLVVITPSQISILLIFFIALGCSLMWPAIWPLAMSDLGKFTKTGSSLMVIAIVGGALIPILYGYLKDVFGPQNAYWIAPPIFIYILYYAFKGHKVRK